MSCPRIVLLMVPLVLAPSALGEAAGPSPEPPARLVDLEGALLRAAPNLRPAALQAGLSSWQALQSARLLARPVLTVIDYSLPSTARRLWVFDLSSRRLIFHELVAHGRNSGEDLAMAFSNDEGSLMTSLGTFVTGESYDGRNGYSLRLRGMEPGLNDRAEARAIVMHGAPYVDDGVARKLGRLGRSHGCPALRPAIARTVIDAIKNGTLLYAWYPSKG
ncbi:MAG TPA: murein L,D-transpeptidase catalytic domain family protein [Candidatus Polarisedimenticolia bacterium]|jgi:hypothetical protein